MQPLALYEIPYEQPRVTSDGSLSPEIREKIEHHIRAAAQNGKILCAGALAIARSLGVRSSDVGKVADAIHIKIAKCQLGCF
ncbi:MAG: hypothetical protein KKH22_12325 [Proteobacteria bacterium]|nr:hypothetical protein [Pseudomonadota bacterium]